MDNCTLCIWSGKCSTEGSGLNCNEFTARTGSAAALIAEAIEACETALFELRHAHEMADDCYERCDATTKTMLDEMLPVRKGDGAIDKLKAVIAKAEGGTQ